MLHPEAKWRDVGKQTRVLKRSRSVGSSPGLGGSAQKRQRPLNEMMLGRWREIEHSKVKTEDEVAELVDVTETAEMTEVGPRVQEGMRTVPVVIFPACSVHNVDFCEVVDEHELTHRESSVASVDLVLSDPPYNVRRGRKDDNSVYDRLSPTDMGDVVDMCKRMMKPGAHGCLFCFAFQFGQ